MAWAMILQDPRFGELTAEEVAVIKEDLLAKVRCYGYVKIASLATNSS
jgi:hypothetical protein